MPPGWFPHCSPRPSAGCGKADAVVAPVEFGVVVPNEAGAQDPEGTSWGWDVQPRESHHTDVLPVLGLLQGGGDPAVMEVPGGRSLLQRARGGAAIPTSTPSAQPRHWKEDPCLSLFFTAHPTSPQNHPRKQRQVGLAHPDTSAEQEGSGKKQAASFWGSSQLR